MLLHREREEKGHPCRKVMKYSTETEKRKQTYWNDFMSNVWLQLIVIKRSEWSLCLLKLVQCLDHRY
jgi:hypothetical protein